MARDDREQQMQFFDDGTAVSCYARGRKYTARTFKVELLEQLVNLETFLVWVNNFLTFASDKSCLFVVLFGKQLIDHGVGCLLTTQAYLISNAIPFHIS
jgi:hypothetical protein